MANRYFISANDDITEPSWISNVEPFVNRVMEKLKFDSQEFSIVFCSDSFMQETNLKYRGIDSSTDVLSFEAGPEVYEEDGQSWSSMGDILISLDMLKKNAQYFNVSENDELKRLIVHGILHLNSYDHGEEHVQIGVEPECEMLRLQESILKELKDFTIIN